MYLLLLLLTSIMTGSFTPSLPATCKEHLQAPQSHNASAHNYATQLCQRLLGDLQMAHTGG